MAQEEFTVVLDGLDLSEEQRVAIDEAIQKAVLDVLPDIDWRPLESEEPPEMMKFVAPIRDRGGRPTMGLIAWPRGKEPWER
jgi:hypothetical protein